MSYSGRKLKFFVENFNGQLESSRQVAELFCLAEDDGQWNELPKLLHPTHSFLYNSFWGLARGPQAAAAVLSAEKTYASFTWTTPLRPVTSRCFYREGYVRLLPQSHQLTHQAATGASVKTHSAGSSDAGIVAWPAFTALKDTFFTWSPLHAVRALFSSMFQKKVTEYVVVTRGQVVYRGVGYDWCMAKQ